MTPAPTTRIPFPSGSSGPLFHPLERDVGQRSGRPAEPAAGAPARLEGDLEEAIQGRVERMVGAVPGEGLAELVEDLVLAEHRAVQSAGDRHEVPCRLDPVETLRSRRRLGKLPFTEALESPVQLDPMAGVDDDRRLVVLERGELGRERLALRGRNPTRLGDEGDERGERHVGCGAVVGLGRGYAGRRDRAHGGRRVGGLGVR